MRVKCIANNHNNISDAYIKAGHFTTSIIDELVEVGKIYTVYGIYSSTGVLSYLINSPWENCPIWHIAEIFEIVDNTIPQGWYFNYWGYGDTNTVNAVWGYRELALDGHHFDGLQERIPEACGLFAIRKMEIDEVS